MNKKILLFGIFAVLMLVTITFASAINTSNTTNIEKKESPLFKIRIRLAIGEKIGQIFENIKTKFLGDRIFIIPVERLKNIIIYRNLLYSCTDCPDWTCEDTSCNMWGRMCTYDVNAKCTSSILNTCNFDAS
ncbi:MAG TPA: hypothetical protein VGB37_03950 [Candidatus Lokiarchaeia archaeon]